MAAIIGRVSAHEGYVGLTQAEARIFITERVPFSALGVAWRIASDVEAIEVGAEMRQSLVANKLNQTVINRCGKNNSAQKPQTRSCRSWSLAEPKPCNARLWIPLWGRA
jgi:hypothetical protein